MRIATLLLLLAVSMPLTAQEGQTVIFAGGTVPSLKSETSGHFELSDPATLAFVYPSGKLSIPFQRDATGEDHDLAIVRCMNPEELAARLRMSGQVLCRNVKCA